MYLYKFIVADYRLEMMGNRHITWVDDGVHLDGNSNAVFTIFERDGEICSSQLQTGYNFMDAVQPKRGTFGAGLTWPIGPMKDPLFVKKFGYFECRCKLQQREGWWSAFWLQSPVIGSTLHASTSGIENDIMESFHPGTCIEHCSHYAGYATDHKCLHAGVGRKDLDKDSYHIFSMLWDETGYTFYIDGVEDGHAVGPVGDRVSQVPAFIMLSTEVQGYRSASKRPTAEAIETAKVGDEFVVDYVRVWDFDE